MELAESSRPPGGARGPVWLAGRALRSSRRGNVTSRHGDVTSRYVAFAAAAEEEPERSGFAAMEAIPVPPASPAALVPATAAGPVAVTGKEVVSPAPRHPKKILDEEAYIEVRRRARAAPLRRCLGRALPARRGWARGPPGRVGPRSLPPVVAAVSALPPALPDLPVVLYRWPRAEPALQVSQQGIAVVVLFVEPRENHPAGLFSRCGEVASTEGLSGG